MKDAREKLTQVSGTTKPYSSHGWRHHVHFLKVHESVYACFIAFMCKRHIFQQQRHKWNNWRLQFPNRHSGFIMKSGSETAERRKIIYTQKFHHRNFNLNYFYIKHAELRSEKFLSALHQNLKEAVACQKMGMTNLPVSSVISTRIYQCFKLGEKFSEFWWKFVPCLS